MTFLHLWPSFIVSLLLVAGSGATGKRRTETYSSYIYKVLKVTGPPVFIDLDGDEYKDMVYGFVDKQGCGGVHIMASRMISSSTKEGTVRWDQPTVELFHDLPSQPGTCDPNFGATVQTASGGFLLISSTNDNHPARQEQSDKDVVVHSWPWQIGRVSGASLMEVNGVAPGRVVITSVGESSCSDPGDVVWDIVDDDISSQNPHAQSCTPCCGPRRCCYTDSAPGKGVGHPPTCGGGGLTVPLPPV